MKIHNPFNLTLDELGITVFLSIIIVTISTLFFLAHMFGLSALYVVPAMAFIRLGYFLIKGF